MPARGKAAGKRSRKRWVWALLVLLLLAAGGWLATQRKPEVQASNVMTAYPSAQYAQLTASGYVVAQRRAAVSSKASGRLLDLRVREGSVVKAGDLLAQLDAADVQAGVLAALAGARQADAALRQAEAGVRQAQVEQANAEAEVQRSTDLQAQGFVSTQALDGVRRRADAARAAVAAAQAGVASAQAGQAQAAAQVRAQQINLADTAIRAPFDGVVLVKNANVGDLITPFSSAAGAQGAVVTMADMGTLEVEADVSESNVGKVRVDMPVEIALDALPELRFRGSVSRIVPTVDRAKATVMTKIRFDKLDPRILPEMSAKVVFLSQPATDADQKPVLAVNPKTVVDKAGKTQVFRLKRDGSTDTVEAVPVTVGRTLGDVVEVTASSGQPPIKAGDRLVLLPPATLEAGARVAVSGK